MGTHNNVPASTNDYGVHVHGYPSRLMDSPSPEADGTVHEQGLVSDWVEMWDYVGGIRFRGFVAENEQEDEKALFVFFDQNMISGLKAGLMALLELASVDYFSCSRLVVCIDRQTEPQDMDVLSKDLGWIGFQLTTLKDFTSDENVISDRWLLMEMDT